MFRFALAALALVASTASATPVVTGVDEVCAAKIMKAVTKAAAKRYGRDTMETFSITEVRLNEAGSADFNLIRLFTVSTSDEVGHGRWLVVTDDEDCVIEHVSVGAED